MGNNMTKQEYEDNLDSLYEEYLMAEISEKEYKKQKERMKEIYKETNKER